MVSFISGRAVALVVSAPGAVILIALWFVMACLRRRYFETSRSGTGN